MITEALEKSFRKSADVDRADQHLGDSAALSLTRQPTLRLRGSTGRYLNTPSPLYSWLMPRKLRVQ